MSLRQQWDCTCGQRGNVSPTCRNCSKLSPALTASAKVAAAVFSQTGGATEAQSTASGSVVPVAPPDPLTPPGIVERADNPPAALGAFIAQELESWGFNVDSPHTDYLHIECGGIALKVNVDWADDS